MFYLEMDVLCSELTPSLIVTEYRINVTDLDYIELGKRLEPTKNVVAINSNFIHKALDGYDQFISKPKVKRTKKVNDPDKAFTKKGRTCSGDHTTFNACIKFTIIIDNEENTKVVRYFLRFDVIQIFSNNIRIHVWLKSEKVNIFGSKAELTGVLIHEFIQDVFSARWTILFVMYLLLKRYVLFFI